MSRLLRGDHEGVDTYYLGDLKAGQRVALRDRYVHFQDHAQGGYTVELCDDPDGKEVAEWGSGRTLEEAWRYALGAMFGPVDAEYDEAHLRTLLDIHKDPNPAYRHPLEEEEEWLTC
jgi:hypothetical protein